MNQTTTIPQIVDIDEIVDLYDRWGGEYYSEAITQTAHAVQAAELAVAAGATDELVAAALLHDIGHLVDLAENGPRREAFDTDLRHEAVGVRVLALMFPAQVTAPIALHVEAKRWRCATDPGYLVTLSDASMRSLVLQGGRMSNDDRGPFEAHPHFRAAVQLREWDDSAKVVRRSDPPFATFLPYLHRVALDA